MVLCWIVYRKVFRKLLLVAGDLVFGANRNEMGCGQEASLADLLKRRIPYAPAIAMGTLMSFFAH
jgi:prepilin peptidase CpaA